MVNFFKEFMLPTIIKELKDKWHIRWMICAFIVCLLWFLTDILLGNKMTFNLWHDLIALILSIMLYVVFPFSKLIQFLESKTIQMNDKGEDE